MIAERVGVAYKAGHDLDIYVKGPNKAPLIFEVKAKARQDGFKTLYGWLEKDDADGLFVKKDRAEPLVVLPWRTWKRLIEDAA